MWLAACVTRDNQKMKAHLVLLCNGTADVAEYASATLSILELLRLDIFCAPALLQMLCQVLLLTA